MFFNMCLHVNSKETSIFPSLKSGQMHTCFIMAISFRRNMEKFKRFVSNITVSLLVFTKYTLRLDVPKGVEGSSSYEIV